MVQGQLGSGSSKNSLEEARCANLRNANLRYADKHYAKAGFWWT